MPSAVLAAAVLAAEGASFLTVGSTALWLHGLPFQPADLDIVPAPNATQLRELRDALASVGVDCRSIPPVTALSLVDVVRLESGLGTIDLLCGRGRAEYAELSTRSRNIAVEDVEVPVAKLADVLRLRNLFKVGPLDE